MTAPFWIVILPVILPPVMTVNEAPELTVNPFTVPPSRTLSVPLSITTRFEGSFWTEDITPPS